MSERTTEVKIESIEIQSGGRRPDSATVTFENGLNQTIKNSNEVSGKDFSAEKFSELKQREESGDLGRARITVYSSELTPDSRCAIKALL